MPTLRIDSGDPLEDIDRRLDEFQPEVLVGYASMLRLLAGEQEAGRLHLRPGAVLSASEVLTADARRRVDRAWGRQPFDVYAATETAGIAAECAVHAGMHLFEDLLITEIVDDAGRPVAPGTYGSKLLVTVLGSRTLPLIRYEISDSVRLLAPSSPCACGRSFARVDGVQGRAEEALDLPAAQGGRVLVQPNVVHRAMDQVDSTGWQVTADDSGITVRVTGLIEHVDTEQIARRLGAQLVHAGARPLRVSVVRVPEIPRTRLGKAPLIRSTRSGTDPRTS
jgi:phenylacetate-coenzyme A ligase PaaK-like adenylate-forming protein